MSKNSKKVEGTVEATATVETTPVVVETVVPRKLQTLLPSNGQRPNRAIRAALETMWVIDGKPGVWTYVASCGKDSTPKDGQVKIKLHDDGVATAYAMLELNQALTEMLSKIRLS